MVSKGLGEQLTDSKSYSESTHSSVHIGVKVHPCSVALYYDRSWHWVVTLLIKYTKSSSRVGRTSRADGQLILASLKLKVLESQLDLLGVCRPDEVGAILIIRVGLRKIR